MFPAEIIRWHKKGERPTIPDTVCSTMQTLISRCWSPDPHDPPSFRDILKDIESNHFRIIPEADENIVREYLLGVLDWEQMHYEKISTVKCPRYD
jgi:hypothetical protein